MSPACCGAVRQLTLRGPYDVLHLMCCPHWQSHDLHQPTTLAHSGGILLQVGGSQRLSHVMALCCALHTWCPAWCLHTVRFCFCALCANSLYPADAGGPLWQAAHVCFCRLGRVQRDGGVDRVQDQHLLSVHHVLLPDSLCPAPRLPSEVPLEGPPPASHTGELKHCSSTLKGHWWHQMQAGALRASPASTLCLLMLCQAGGPQPAPQMTGGNRAVWQVWPSSSCGLSCSRLQQ